MSRTTTTTRTIGERGGMEESSDGRRGLNHRDLADRRRRHRTKGMVVTEWLKDVRILHRQGSEHCFGTSPNTSSQERALAVPESIARIRSAISSSHVCSASLMG